MYKIIILTINFCEDFSKNFPFYFFILLPTSIGLTSNRTKGTMNLNLTYIMDRKHMAPSRELRLKKDKMKSHKKEYLAVQTMVYAAAGGISMDEILDLQKRVKQDLGLRTSRVDWRTKTGIILWFCDNWEVISPQIFKYMRQPIATKETERRKVEVVQKEAEMTTPEVLPFEDEEFDFTNYSIFDDESTNSSEIAELWEGHI